MVSKFSFTMFLLATSVVVAADDMPKPGSHGFNWLDPESSCKQLTDKDLARISKCSLSDNAFGLELRSHVCRVDEHTELMIYATAAQCHEAWETMQANGP